MFVDPRVNPHAPFAGTRPAPAADPLELTGLTQLCESGRLYEVEQWVRDGKPIHADTYRRHGRNRVSNPLEIAIRTKQRSLAILLLANGFPPDSDGSSLLEVALDDGRREYVDLLLSWGADPKLVSPFTVLDTYEADVYERFWRLGLDFTNGHALARVLSRQSIGTSAYGWARGHRDDPRIMRELSVALLQAVVENRERAVGLLMWAGADPRKPVPDLRYSRNDDVDEDDDWSTAMVHAVMYGHGHLLKSLKPQADRDDCEKLWAWVCDEAALDHLAKLARPSDWSPVLTRNLQNILSYSSGRGRNIVERLTVEYGARLTTMSPESISYFRREVLRCTDDSRSRFVLRWLSYAETCEPALFAELTRTPAVRTKLNSLHIHDARYRY